MKNLVEKWGLQDLKISGYRKEKLAERLEKDQYDFLLYQRYSTNNSRRRQNELILEYGGKIRDEAIAEIEEIQAHALKEAENSK